MNWDDVRTAGLALPGVEVSTAYGRPALKLRGKIIACVGRSDDHVVLMLDLERIAFLKEMEPGLFFQTPHYEGWPAVLIRFAEWSREDLAPLLREAWERRATRKMIQQLPATHACDAA